MRWFLFGLMAFGMACNVMDLLKSDAELAKPSAPKQPWLIRLSRCVTIGLQVATASWLWHMDGGR